VKRVWFVFFLPLLFILASFQAHALSEGEKIRIIIESVKDTPKGTQFIRNSKAYSADEVVSHLNLKYSKAKSKVKTAEDFIKYVASRSSASEEEYLIRYPDGTTITSAVFFTERLRKLEGK
jgi:hypothetical protein